jgi:hypothetical protein
MTEEDLRIEAQDAVARLWSEKRIPFKLTAYSVQAIDVDNHNALRGAACPRSAARYPWEMLRPLAAPSIPQSRYTRLAYRNDFCIIPL